MLTESEQERMLLRRGFLARSRGPKRGTEAATNISDDTIRDALNAALRRDPDPDGDGDLDRSNPVDDWRSFCWCYVRRVFPLEGWFVYWFEGGDEDGDTGLYRRSYTLDENNEAILGDDTRRVREEITYVDWVPDTADAQTAEALREAGAIHEIANFTIATFERAEDAPLGKITGTAIKPGFNKSKKRYYPKETLAAAVEGFVGKKMYINHPSKADERNRPERDLRDQAAVIEDAWVEGDGGIGYKAVIIDRWLDDRLALMAERGVLGAQSTSVNYSGDFTPRKVEGLTTDYIESMDLMSLDFVTEAGAWGDVAHLEADAAAAANERGDAAAEETDDMVDEKVLATMQETIDKLATQNATLIESIGSERTARLKSEARQEVKDCLAESGLPETSKKKLLAQFDGRESAEGIAAAIADEIAYVEELTGRKLGEAAAKPETEREKLARLRGAGKRVVVGNGESARESDRPKPKPIAETGGSWLFGDAEGAKRFEATFIS